MTIIGGTQVDGIIWTLFEENTSIPEADFKEEVDGAPNPYRIPEIARRVLCMLFRENGGWIYHPEFKANGIKRWVGVSDDALVVE